MTRTHAESSCGPARGFLPKLRRALPWISAVLFCVAMVLVWRRIEDYGPRDVLRALGAIPWTSFALSAACALGSYATLTTFDWLAIRWTRATVSYPQAAFTSFVSLSVGHTVGIAALSSGAIRYRLYSHFGMRDADVLRLILFGGVTVGLGLVSVAALGALSSSADVARVSDMSRGSVLAIGTLLAALALAYAASPLFAPREFSLKSLAIRWPAFGTTTAQLAAGTVNYLLLASSLRALLGERADVSVLAFAAVYVGANAAGVASHVPGGVGVFEAVMLLVFGDGAQVAGALIAFRVVYYFVPLAIGSTAFVLFEVLKRRRSERAREDPRHEVCQTSAHPEPRKGASSC